MAPTKYHLTMFLAIALIAAMLQPLAATRAEPPSSTTTTSPQQSSTWSSLLAFCFHWPPIFSPPTPPPPPSKPQPKECLTPLMKLMPCKDYLTYNSTAPAPARTGKCCDGYKSLIMDAPICICRIADRELDKLMSAELDFGRLTYDLLGICQVEPVGPNCDDPVPPMKPAAPTPEAAP
ncbi:unnamed protein product [Alopecurus aequalis]